MKNDYSVTLTFETKQGRDNFIKLLQSGTKGELTVTDVKPPKTINVIQLPAKQANLDPHLDGGEFSTPECPLYVKEYDYSQGQLSWTATPDPLKAYDLHTNDRLAHAQKLFVTGFNNRGGIIRTFQVAVEEVKE